MTKWSQCYTEKFADYCQPRKSVPFERSCFNRPIQESGELYEQYRMPLRKLSVGCDFQFIMPEEILRNRLLSGIWNNKVRERLLREPRLTLAKTDNICRAREPGCTNENHHRWIKHSSQYS